MATKYAYLYANNYAKCMWVIDLPFLHAYDRLQLEALNEWKSFNEYKLPMQCDQLYRNIVLTIKMLDDKNYALLSKLQLHTDTM